jgi:hypothetical protein
MSLDVSKFKNCRVPRTEVKCEMINRSLPVLFRFFKYKLDNGDFEDVDEWCISVNDFFDEISEYVTRYERGGSKITLPSVSAMVSKELGVVSARKQVEGSRCMRYTFTSKIISDYMKKHTY